MPQKRTAATLAALAVGAVAQTCIPLAGSTTCSAFNQSSISTDADLVGFFPFLASVSSVDDFDRELTSYVNQSYIETKYTTLFGCDNVNLANTSNYYARYTTSFICNSIVQNSLTPCGGTARPLCADSCGQLALSEEAIVSNDEFCNGRDPDYAAQLRADFTNCALPARSLSGICVTGAANEPENCGFGSNIVGLCNFCRASTTNATDSCCLTSDTEDRCQGVELPVFSSIAGLVPSSTSAPGPSQTGGSNVGGSQNGSGLSGGAIAGIVIGSVVGFALLLALIVFGCILLRRRRSTSSNSSMLNQPSPQRKGVPAMSTASYPPPPSSSQQGYEVLPGGRVARMTAMQNDEAPDVGPRSYPADTYGATPAPAEKTVGLVGGPKTSPDNNSSSPDSNDYSSPEGVASGQSEQLPFFKDYYSNDDIHPNDRVSVLWAYQPRAGDEFELERGDMLKVVGIWDDGWATGVRISDRAEDYEGKHKLQRDSGMSSGTAHREGSPPPSSEIKAFPLVCVCLPEAWRRTVEGDSSTEGGSAGVPQ